MDARLAKPQPRIDPLLFDVVLAVGLTLLVWAQLATPRLLIMRGMPVPPPFGGGQGGFMLRAMLAGPAHYVIASLALLPLALRRLYPLPVLAAVTAAAGTFELITSLPALTIAGPVIALYTVATLRDRGTIAVAAASLCAVMLLTTLPPFANPRWVAEFVRIVAVVVSAAGLGDAARNRRAYVAEVERRAAEAEARAEEEALRRVDEERLRIARELHDITAHSMSVIAVQSGMASHVIEQDPEAARRALDDIRATSKRALQELRSVLGVMRSAGESEPPLAPTPGLARLPELVHAAEEAGFTVRTETEGEFGSLPQLVDASAYRIAQEALTNAIRHAQPAELSVRVIAEDDSLALEIANGGAREGAGGAEGHGIAGMRERALALGGTFSAGPLPDGRWRVSATLPTTGRPA